MADPLATGGGRLAVAGATALALTMLAGCGLLGISDDGGDAETDSEAGAESGAETETESDSEGGEAQSGEEPERPSVVERPVAGHPDTQANVVLQRLDEDYLVAEFQVVNNGNEDMRFYTSELVSPYGDDSAFPDEWFSGIGWVDSAASTLNLPLHFEDRSCLCSHVDPTDNRSAEAGEPLTLGAVLPAPPEGVEQLTVVTGTTLPFVNVPISEGEPDLQLLDLDHPDDTSGAQPQQLRLESVVERGDRSGSIVEDSEGTDFNLANDVLFDTDSAELTSEADELIEETAEDIAAAGATELSIEGHADDTGTDDINDPLSQDRAESVRDALDEHLDGDISYEVEGFGSQEPLYDDDSDEAREQNRRVTISIPESADVDAGGGEDADEESDEEDADEESDEESDNANDESSENGSSAGQPVEDFSGEITGTYGGDSIEAEVQLTGLHRIADDMAVLTYEITNTMDEDINPYGLLRDASPRETGGRNAEGAQLIDTATDRVYANTHLFVDEVSDGAECVCSELDARGDNNLNISASAEYYNLMSIEAGVTEVDVQIGDGDPFTDVEVAG